MAPIRILLADDNPEFLHAATNFLATDPQLEIVGQARSGQQARDQVSDLQPRLVIMDLAMPGTSGLEATRQIKTQANPPYVIILTLYDNAEYRAEAERMGADGFVAKSDMGTELLPLIHTLCNNRADL
jgi:DNA-binding NarL/FixJ family response regulator